MVDKRKKLERLGAWGTTAILFCIILFSPSLWVVAIASILLVFFMPEHL